MRLWVVCARKKDGSRTTMNSKQRTQNNNLHLGRVLHAEAPEPIRQGLHLCQSSAAGGAAAVKEQAVAPARAPDVKQVDQQGPGYVVQHRSRAGGLSVGDEQLAQDAESGFVGFA